MPLHNRQFVEVETGPEWRTVRAALERNSRTGNKDLGKALKSSLGPIVNKVRAQALDLPSHGAKHTGLRLRLAASVRVEDRGESAVRIVSDMPPGENGVARGMDNGPAGWRHPVYGNKDVWVHQRGGSWFKEPIADSRNEIERKLTNALEQMADNIANAGRI